MAEGFKYGNYLSLTWEFEAGDYDGEEEDEFYEWGFYGDINYTDEVVTSVTGYFYCFEYDEDDERSKVSKKYEGKFTLKDQP